MTAPDQTVHKPGEFVLYWMHNAIRGHENPALDVAIHLAHQNGLPLLVYHGLSENYPFASDRHHAFIMQAARDAQREFRELGITYVFHLERYRHRGPHLRDLARRAAVLVTESMPVAPLVDWTERLQSLVSTPIVSVDTTCLLSMAQVTALAEADASNQTWFHRASRYHELTIDAYQKIVGQEYEAVCGDCGIDPADLPSLSLDTIRLGFEPVDLQDRCLAELIGECDIDHAVAPIADSPGGMKAGYERWRRFRDCGLNDYSRRRTDPADMLGGSRLSAYLHYGMISPFRIAREVSGFGGADDADKFLNEFLIWREMSFHFCERHHHDLDTFESIPHWAGNSLRDHITDQRIETLEWESLARAKSSQPLWNTAQRSLIKHGELHNSVRMTWGKAFLSMTVCPEQALNHCIDLNHRYALDGRSPASYGGILWCFGQFDQPHEPQQELFGKVRPRSVGSQVNRIDMKRFSERCDRPIAATVPRVAVIGAGIGGLIAARTLADHGLDVVVFDKSIGVGGRLATRRNRDEPSFDHGAQYFTVRDDRFARYVRSWISAGVVAAWMKPVVELCSGEIVQRKRALPRYVGTPAMNSIAKHLAEDVDVLLGNTVTAIRRDPATDTWTIRFDDDPSRDAQAFDALILNCPPEQAGPLLSPHTHLANQIERVRMKPCWAVMLSCDGIDDLPYAGAFINSGPLSWISRDDSKPGRTPNPHPGRSNWVLHASADWSEQHLEDDSETVIDQLIAGFEAAIGRTLGTVHHRVAHRWRYANPIEPLERNHLWDRTTMIGVCGDWCGGPRVEGAFLSGTAVAGSLLRHITIDRKPGQIAMMSVQATFV